MQLIFATIASTLAALGDLLVKAMIWLGRSLAVLLLKFVTEPMGFVVRFKDVVFAGVIMAIVLAEAWDIWRRLIAPLIHANSLTR